MTGRNPMKKLRFLALSAVVLSFFLLPYCSQVHAKTSSLDLGHPNIGVRHGPYTEPNANFIVFDSVAPFPFTLQGSFTWDECTNNLCAINNPSVTYVDQWAWVNDATTVDFSVNAVTWTYISNGSGGTSPRINPTNPDDIIFPQGTAWEAGNSNPNYSVSASHLAAVKLTHYESSGALAQYYTTSFNHSW